MFRLSHLVCCLAVFGHASAQSPIFDTMKDFYREKMANYPAWMSENNQDPSRLVEGPTHFRARQNGLANLDVYLSNHGVKGHGSGEIDIQNIEVELVRRIGAFRADFDQNGNITFFGDYSANGTLLSGTGVNVKGTWYINVPMAIARHFRVHFKEQYMYGFLTTDIYWIEDVHPGPENSTNGVTIHFENLLESGNAEGSKDEIEAVLYQAFSDTLRLNLDINHPLKTMYLDYWQKVFEETTLADFGLPPPTTLPPCQGYFQGNGVAQAGHSDNENVLEKTVEKHTEVGRDGIPRIITKTVIVTEQKLEL